MALALSKLSLKGAPVGKEEAKMRWAGLGRPHKEAKGDVQTQGCWGRVHPPGDGPLCVGRGLQALWGPGGIRSFGGSTMAVRVQGLPV